MNRSPPLSRPTSFCSSGVNSTNSEVWKTRVDSVFTSQFMAFSISAWFSIKTASFSLMILLHPREYKSLLRPGKAKTSRLYELAMSAVTNAPPFSALSTMMVASASPAMMRLRRRKFCLSMMVSLIKSVINPPFSIILLAIGA